MGVEDKTEKMIDTYIYAGMVGFVPNTLKRWSSHLEQLSYACYRILQSPIRRLAMISKSTIILLDLLRFLPNLSLNRSTECAHSTS